MVVETAQGIEFAKCSEGNHDVPEDAVVQPLRSVVQIGRASCRERVLDRV